MLNTTQLLERLAKEYEVTAALVVDGNCSTMEDYRAKCARLRTLEQVREIALGKDQKSEGSTHQDRS